MASEREGFLDFRGMKVWYHVAGPLPAPPGTPPLLLLHGGPGGSSDGFEPFDALADQGRTVIRYDELGSGRSDRPHDPSLWTPATFVDLLDRVRTELALDPVHLLGWSWGGMLIMEYFRRQPKGVASVTLTSAPASIPDYIEDADRLRATLPKHVLRAMARFESRWEPPTRKTVFTVDPGLTSEAIDKQAAMMRRMATLAARPASVRIVAALTRLFPRSQALYDAVGLAYVTEHIIRARPLPLSVGKMLAATSREVYETMWGPSEFFGGGTLVDWDAHDWLGQIDVPALVTCGRHDTVPPDRAKVVADRIPDAELVVFEESGHSAMYDEPERYFATLTDFLARVDARRAGEA